MVCWLLSSYFSDSNLLFYTLLFDAVAGTLHTMLLLCQLVPLRLCQ